MLTTGILNLTEPLAGFTPHREITGAAGHGPSAQPA
jgi:hypothetical protein